VVATNPFNAIGHFHFFTETLFVTHGFLGVLACKVGADVAEPFAVGCIIVDPELLNGRRRARWNSGLKPVTFLAHLGVRARHNEAIVGAFRNGKAGLFVGRPVFVFSTAGLRLRNECGASITKESLQAGGVSGT